jgi:hypothetical protein
MITLSYGFKKPELKDLGPVVFPALEDNWQQVNDHDHDGLNSAKINIDANLPLQTGNAGKFLTTNGTVSSWATVAVGEVNTASNVGGGNGLFKQKSGVDLEFKTLVAGANTTITPVGDTLVIASSYVDTGEVNTASNVGGGSGLFKQKSGVDLEFYTLAAGSGVSLTQVGDTIQIASTVVPGESNTASNVGGGSGLFKQKVGVDLQFYTLAAGSGVSLTQVGDTVQIASTIVPGESNTASNVGGGSGLFKQKTGVNLEFYTLAAGSNITLTQVGDTIQIASTASGANTTLSNLGVTAINSSLVSAADNTLDLGSTTNRWFNIHGQVISGYSQIGWRDFATALPILNMFATAFLTATNGAFISGPHQNLGVTYDAFGFRGRNANVGVASLPIIIGTGNGGTGANSGGILLQTGTSTATRGKIQFKDGTEGTAGHVWTSSDTNGNGRWQVLPGASITAGMFVKAYSSTGFNNVFAPSYQDFPMDTLVEDTHSMYNTGNGEITIPLSYSGQARGIITLTLCLNSSVQTSYIRTQIYKNGSFYGYGAAFNNTGVNNANEIYQGTFHVTGVAGDKFKVGYYSNSNNFMAGGAGASRIDVSFFPK